MDQFTELLLQSSFTSDGNSSESGPSSLNSFHYSDTLSFADLTTTANSNFGAVGFRTRHLSCIEENECDAYNSLPSDFINDAEKSIIVALGNKLKPCEDEDIDCITTLNEAAILDTEPEGKHIAHNWTSDTYESFYSMFEANNMTAHKNSTGDLYGEGTNVSSGALVNNYPEIMTTSCYGSLNNSTGTTNDDHMCRNDSADTFLLEPVYAVVDKQINENYQTTNINGSVLKTSACSIDFSEPEIKATGNILELSVTSVDGSRFGWSEDSKATQDMNTDLQGICRLLENGNSGSTCPSCKMLFDKGKKRKLIDTCGHERCYSCMFSNEMCPLCTQEDLQPQDFHLLRESASRKTDQMQLPTLQSNGTNGCFALLQPRLNTISPICPKIIDKNKEYCDCHNYSNGSLISATPPQQRRTFFNPKLRSPFGINRRAASSSDTITSGAGTESTSISHLTDNKSSVQWVENKYNRLNLAGSSTYAGHLSSLVFGKIKSLWNAQSNPTNDGLNLLADDGNAKSLAVNSRSGAKHGELQTRLAIFLENNSQGNGRIPMPSDSSSLTSENTSPVSTLTSGAQFSKVLQECNLYSTECDSIGSSMSVSVSGQSTMSSSSLGSRLPSISTAQKTRIDNSSPFKTKKYVVTRSAKTTYSKTDQKNQLAQYRIQQLTLKPLFFEVPLQEPDPLFIGRQWILRELLNILTTTEVPGVLIIGNPGTGKTALILQLVEYSCFGRRKEMPLTKNEGIYCQINVCHDRIRALASHVVAYHFCQVDNNYTCLVPDFIHSLAAQLCQAPQLAAYREYLMSEPSLQNILSVKECVADPDRVMRMGILEPLETLKRSGKINVKHCIILIDALCEAEYHRPDHGYTISSFLRKISEYFPSWFKVVATVRTQMLEFAKGLSYTKITLDNWCSNEFLQKDIVDYIIFRIRHSPSIQSNIGSRKDSNPGQKFITQMLAHTKGSFLYAKLALDLIERGYLVIKSSSFKVMPVSLAEIYLLHFNMRFPTVSSYDKVSPILSICLATLFPLTLNEIYYSMSALNADESLTWEDFFQRFKLINGFLVKRIDNTYMFFHPSFREWLIRRYDGESSKFLCDLKLGHAAIAFRLSRLQTPLDSEQTLELGHHILKAHLYRNSQLQSLRDTQAYWMASVSNSVSSALCTLRNALIPNIKVSRLLLLAGACPNYQTDFLGGATILCIASYEGIVPMVNILLEFGADVEKTTSQSCTPLILASLKGHFDVVRLLMAAGSRPGQSDTTQHCALVHAARSGKVNIVKYLLACDWKLKAHHQDTSIERAQTQALVVAASQGNMSIVEDLLDMTEVSVDAIDSLTGDTALTAAARHGCTDTVSILLSRGAIVDQRNRQENTPLLLAVKEGHWAVVERLLRNNSDIEQIENETKKTPLIIASEEGHVGIIELLIENGSSFEKKDLNGLTPLSWACLRDRLQATKCLLERGANIENSDKSGRTALDLASYQGSSTLVQFLLDKGATIEHMDINEMRPIDRAIACHNIPVVQIFLKRGAKLGPATWTLATEKPDAILLLLNKLLEDGNILYRKNHLHEAAHRYRYALRKIPTTEPWEHKDTFRQLKFNFLLNLSRCKRKMNELEEAINLATEAVEIRPSGYEGYYARAKAYLKNCNKIDALQDSNIALENAQNIPEAVRDVLNRLRNKIINASTKPYEIIDETTDL